MQLCLNLNIISQMGLLRWTDYPHFWHSAQCLRSNVYKASHELSFLLFFLVQICNGTRKLTHLAFFCMQPTYSTEKRTLLNLPQLVGCVRNKLSSDSEKTEVWPQHDTTFTQSTGICLFKKRLVIFLLMLNETLLE